MSSLISHVESCPLLLLAEPFNFVEHEVDVWLRCGGIRHDHAEEVWLHAKRLVSDHGASFLHHHCLDLRRHLNHQNTIASACHLVLAVGVWDHLQNSTRGNVFASVITIHRSPQSALKYYSISGNFPYVFYLPLISGFWCTMCIWCSHNSR